MSLFFFFFNDTATTEIYTLSLHDALPISETRGNDAVDLHPETEISIGIGPHCGCALGHDLSVPFQPARSEEHTSELQSQSNLVCRLLLEKKKNSPATRLGDRLPWRTGISC